MGWAWMLFGLLSGSIIGTWVFNGPVQAPKGHDEYSGLPRRLARIGHINCFVFAILCILYGLTIDNVPLTHQIKLVGAYAMIVLMVGLSLLPFLMLKWPKLKYCMAIPVVSAFIGIGIISYGHYKLIV